MSESSSNSFSKMFKLIPLNEKPMIRQEQMIRRNLLIRPAVMPKLTKIDFHTKSKRKSPNVERFKLSMILIGHQAKTSTKLTFPRHSYCYQKPKPIMVLNDYVHDSNPDIKINENSNMVSHSDLDFQPGSLNTTMPSLKTEDPKSFLGSDDNCDIRSTKIILSPLSSGVNDLSSSVIINHNPEFSRCINTSPNKLSSSVDSKSMMLVLPTALTAPNQLPNIKEPRNYDSPLTYVKKQRFMEDPLKADDVSVEKSKKKLRPKVTAKSWSITDGENSELLYGKRERRHREIASLTKIMTCFVALKWVRKLKMDLNMTFFKVSAMAASMIGTTANLKAGDELSVWDLLHGMMLPSGNDAAYCLAENFGFHIYYTTKDYKEKIERNPDIEVKPTNPIKYFVREMNYISRDLGMIDTHYANPHGLIHKYNHSTAADIGKLCAAAMKDDLIRKIVSNTIYFSTVKSRHTEAIRELVWRNTNKLLYDGFEGIKTGITSTAGPCLAASLRRDNKHLIVVILNSKSSEHRWNEVKKLMNWALEEHLNDN